MRYLFLLIVLMTFLNVNAQQNFPVIEEFVDVYNNDTELPIICIDRNELYVVGVALKKKKNNSLSPLQSVGELTIFEKKLLMSNPDRWQFKIEGNAYAYDIIRTTRNRTIVVGAFVDSIRINQQTIFSNPFHFSSFVISLDSLGNFEWIKTNYFFNQNWIATSVDEDDEKNLVVVGLKNDIYTIVWKYNPINGDSLLYKSFDEVRTLTSVKCIDDHYYISGTVDDFGSLDTFTIRNPQQTGYNVFLAKLDKQFNVKWLRTKPYITFDFHSELEVSWNEFTLFWANYSLDSVQGLVQNLCIIDTNNNILKEKNYTAQFTNFEFDNKLIESSSLYANSFYYIKENNDNYYMNLIGTNGLSDSILIFNNSNVELYDFEGENLLALAGILKGDTLRSITSRVPNVNADSNKFMNFITYYLQGLTTSVNEKRDSEIFAYPNPVDKLLLFNSTEIQEIVLLDLNGKELLRCNNHRYVDLNDLDTGMYILKIKVADRYLHQKIIKK